MKTAALLAAVTACGSPAVDTRGHSPSPTATPPPQAPLAAPAGEPVTPPAPGDREAPPTRVDPSYLAAPDRAGARKRYPTAVLLVSARPDARTGADAGDLESPPRYHFIPLACAIRGKLSTGVACGEAMPARTTVRTPSGDLAVARSAKPFHDEAGGTDYPAPYGPECCMYNTCVGKTVPYDPVSATVTPADHRTVFAVWPADADIDFEAAGDDPKADTPPLAAGQYVLQAVTRGPHHFATIGTRHSGTITWKTGSGWMAPTTAPLGPRGEVLVGTSDLDHDGHYEMILWQIWANDFGMSVFSEADATPLHEFSCGNI